MMSTCAPTLQPHIKSCTPLAGWRVASSEIEASRHYVTVDLDGVAALIPWLKPGAPNDAWRSYVSPVDDAAPDLSRLYFELALTVSQFGGFIGFRSDGELAMWKHEGSGVKAILATMAQIRAAKKLPGIDIHDDFDRQLAHFFIDTPFGSHRLAMLKELGAPEARSIFDLHLKVSRRSDGSYCFSVLQMLGLAARFPLSFGHDKTFYKKATLVLLTMEIALNQLGKKATTLTPPAADYRIPQILEGLGILRLDEALSAKIIQGHIFKFTSPEVRALRIMTVEAIGHIKSHYEHQIGVKTTCAELDGALYLLSRNHALMAGAKIKPHILVATAAF